MGRYRTLALGLIGICGTLLAKPTSSFAQVDPASEPSVLAVAKALPAVVNINAERIVRRTVRDPIDDFYAQFFGNYRSRPREIRQKQQSLGSAASAGFLGDGSDNCRRIVRKNRQSDRAQFGGRFARR